MSAMLHGAVMEGSWGSEVTQVADADAAVQCRMARAAGQGQPCASRAISAIAAAGLRALAALMK